VSVLSPVNRARPGFHERAVGLQLEGSAAAGGREVKVLWTENDLSRVIFLMRVNPASPQDFRRELPCHRHAPI